MWRAEVTHDNDRHCEFHTGFRLTPMDETSDICRPKRHGRACPWACPGHPRRPTAPLSPNTAGDLSVNHLGRVQAEPRGWPGQARP